ncbi:hypothetical protein ACKI1I_46470 [Streptomyces turgidiscabies]|uniref:Uncharacterized protein n=1 Tax=Streptomyces turgidiscabies (strain Car8) TaxID=698760 RepID=L7F093_STRT8|nr:MULTISPECIES: hypothetical protein [Streptomyces]ELP64411.1 hypothetical protein STRTUCAR8_04639 [Streptomyces turgidiscabies Car8]MDX3495685.1 hypothetical protein [Streptomyces turgidiscabies]GAQ75541.1 hypothetical protein T45_07326 [Streptomyces turgidiscabies]
MTDEAAEYHCLWDGSEAGWVVLRTEVALGAIYNINTRMALLVEDNAVYARVIELMRTHERPFLDSLP